MRTKQSRKNTYLHSRTMATTQTNTANASASLPATSRTRERPAGDEEADVQLSLGEFTGVPSLSLSEARHIINAVMESRRTASASRGGGGRIEETETLVKTQDYLDVFARFKQKENIEAVERLLSSRTELAPFERSQLGALISRFCHSF